MLERFLFGHTWYRTFSRSGVWRNVEKVKAPESPATSSPSSSEQILDMSMTLAPTELDKKILLLSGKFKSRKDIPPRVRFETMDNAKSRLRIRVSLVMMLVTVLASLSVIAVGKKRQREGDSLLKRLTDRDNKLKEEYRKSKEQ